MYPTQSVFYVPLCNRVSPFTGRVEVRTTIPVHHTSVSMVDVSARVFVSEDTIPSEGISLQTLQEVAIIVLQHNVEVFFECEMERGERETDVIGSMLIRTLADCGFHVEGVTFVGVTRSSAPCQDLQNVFVA